MRFPFGSIALLGLVLFATAGTSIAQKSDISERDFLAVAGTEAYRATVARYPRKQTRTCERLADGKITSLETEVIEFLASDKYRVITTVVSKGKTITTEERQVGEIRYCKNDSSEWKMYCPEPPPAPAMSRIAGAQYSLEIGANTKTYQRIYQSIREDKEKLTKSSFATVDRSVLNNDSSHRDRSIITTNSETKEVVTRFTEKVEYGIKLEPIEAPVK